MVTEPPKPPAPPRTSEAKESTTEAKESADLKKLQDAEQKEAKENEQKKPRNMQELAEQLAEKNPLIGMLVKQFKAKPEENGAVHEVTQEKAEEIRTQFGVALLDNMSKGLRAQLDEVGAKAGGRFNVAEGPGAGDAPPAPRATAAAPQAGKPIRSV